MLRRRLMDAGKLLVTTILVLIFTDSSTVAGLSKEEIAQAIQKLGDKDFKTRAEAEMFLWKAGPSAIPALRNAAKNPDPEISTRAKKILGHLRYGILPDTPKNIKELIGRYKKGNDKTKGQVVSKLAKLRREARDVLLSLFRVEDEDDLLRIVSHIPGETYPRIIPYLIRADKVGAAAALLRIRATRAGGALPHASTRPFSFFEGALIGRSRGSRWHPRTTITGVIRNCSVICTAPREI